MKRLLTTSFLTMAFTCIYIPAAHADSLPAASGAYQFVLPDANENPLPTVNGNGFGFYSQEATTTIGGMVDTSANLTFTSANGANFSFAQASISTGGLFNKSVFYVADASVDYYIEVKGPDNTTVPLDIFASGSTQVASSVSNYLIISGFDVYNGNQFVFDGSNYVANTPIASASTCIASFTGVFDSYSCSNDTSSSFSYSNGSLFMTNTLYEVTTLALVEVIPSLSIFGTAPLVNGTQLDPSFSIDPTYAATGLYTLETSDSGIPATAATPEPSSVVLAVTGILCASLPLAWKRLTIQSR